MFGKFYDLVGFPVSYGFVRNEFLGGGFEIFVTNVPSLRTHVLLPALERHFGRKVSHVVELYIRYFR